jgi:hypothetical protein
MVGGRQTAGVGQWVGSAVSTLGWRSPRPGPDGPNLGRALKTVSCSAGETMATIYNLWQGRFTEVWHIGTQLTVPQ